MRELLTDAMSPKEMRSLTPAIEFQSVSKSFGTVQALYKVSFAIPQGQVVALLGPNGAGKTTAISLMLGLRRPSHGQACLLGRDPHNGRARSRCGIMLQESGVPLTLTVRETITLFRSYYPHPLPLAHILDRAGLTMKAAASIGSLSGGQRQRLYFALAMLLLLSAFAVVAGGVQLSGAEWITLITSLVLGALPFIALGFAIGNVVDPTAAAPITNVSFLIFSFASGIFVPLSQLPDVLQNIAPYLPLYRLAQLAWNAVGAQTGSIDEALWLLLLYGIVFLGLAFFAYRTEEQRTFG